MLESSIQVASRLCGVGVHTLRAWEKRYAAVTPQRAENGRRLYSEEDICKLQMLNELCHHGNSISAIANCSNVELSQLLAKFTKKERLLEHLSDDYEKNEANSPNALSHLVLALDTYKLDVISHELNKLVRTLNPKDLVHNILMPLLQEINTRVTRGALSSDQVSAISSMIRFHAGDILYLSHRQAARSGKVFIFSSPQMLGRDLGILSCALLCTHYRHKIFYFDHHLSSDALGQTVEAVNADYVVLDTTHQSLTNLENYLTKLLYQLKQNQKFILFGDDQFVSEDFYKHRQFKFIGSLQKFDDFLKEI